MSKKPALLFGGSRGIGAACVQPLAEGGFDVASERASWVAGQILQPNGGLV